MTESTYTLRFADSDCNSDNVPLVGGKNASLGELMSIGDDVRVPPGFAVTTAFYERFLTEHELAAYVEDRLDGIDCDDTTAVTAASEDIRARIEHEPYPPKLDTALEQAWRELQASSPDNDLEVAVRSSATAEDLPDASFAGQQDTYLNVSSIEQVKQRTKECMASLFTPRAIAYREEQGFDHDEVLISVGIQKMVDARTSGVMFTVNPANGDRSKVRIEASWGLGEAVVSGEVNPDSFLVDKPVYKIVDRNIQIKEVMTESTATGTEEVPVDDDKRSVPSLTADEIIKLTDLAKAIENYYGDPQDIEWAIEESGDEKQFYILQSRPETTWDQQNDQQASDTNEDTSGSDSPADRILDQL